MTWAARRALRLTGKPGPRPGGARAGLGPLLHEAGLPRRPRAPGRVS